jgi:hypothetical protein
MKPHRSWKGEPDMGSNSSKVLLICRQCGIKHSVQGKFITSTIEVDAETLAEVDTITLVKECPDCWDPVLRGK